MDFSDYYRIETTDLINSAHYLADILSGDKAYSWGNGFSLQTVAEHKLSCVWLLAEHTSELKNRRTMCPALSDKLDNVAKCIYEQITIDEGIVDIVERQQSQFPWLKALLAVVQAISDHGNIGRVCRYWIPFMSLLVQNVRVFKKTVLEHCTVFLDRLANDEGDECNHLLLTLQLAVDVANAAAAVGDSPLEEVVALWVKKALSGNQPDWVFDLLQRYDLQDHRPAQGEEETMYPILSASVRKELLEVAKRDLGFSTAPRYPKITFSGSRLTLKTVR